jgi:hypothetical protein
VNKSAIAIVVGGAACNFDDIASLPETVVKSAAFVAVNDVGAVLNYPLRGWVSLHPEKFLMAKPFWITQRLANNLDVNGCNVFGWSKDSAPRNVDGVTCWSDYLSQGSSGLFGVGAAIMMGYKKIICCGIPMNLQINKFLNRPSFSTDKAADLYRPFWEANLPLLKDRVFSQSGWTKQLLGPWPENNC